MSASILEVDDADNKGEFMGDVVVDRISFKVAYEEKSS
jgi:hypothetical protein